MNDLPSPVAVSSQRPMRQLSSACREGRCEDQIPALAEQATREAYERALQSGFAVTVLRGDSIVQVMANGEFKELKKLAKARQPITQRYFTIP